MFIGGVMCLGFASVQELQVHGAWSSPFSAAEWKKNSTRWQGTEAAGVVATAVRILAPHLARQQLLQSVAHPAVVLKAQLDEEEKAAASRDHGAGKKMIVEKLWENLFANPSQWWDHRLEKGNVRYPDFKHKETQEALWLDGKFKPSWVDAELAGLPPGSLQSNVFSWNSMLARSVKAGQNDKAMRLFQQMRQDGIVPNSFSFVQVLKACASLQALEKGRCVHQQIIKSGCESDVFVSNSLVDMYAKCGSIWDAQIVFNRMRKHTVVSWSTMILGHVKCGQGKEALELYRQMQLECVQPDPITFVGVLNACASIVALEEGRCVHEQIIQSNFESNLFVGNSLIDMYSKCGSIDDAWMVFNRMPSRDVVSWNIMILGHVKCGQGQKALALGRQMQLEGIKPDPVTFVGILKACTSVAGLEEGKRVHEQIIQSGCGSNVSVANTLIDMYMKCGSIDNAQNVFNNMPIRDVISWNVMLLGYLKCGQGQKALALSQQMLQDGVQPDAVTFIGFLNVCASAVALEEGKHIHKQIIQSEYKSDVFVGSSLIDMYGKCGSIEDAEKVFNRMHTRNVVAWSAMIQAHVKCGQGQKALALYRQMQRGGVEPDPAVFVAVLNACAILAALEEGRHIEEQIIQRGYQSDVFVIASLLDMYAKCGSIVDAQRVFNSMPTQHVVCWTAMLGCYAMHGHAKEALGHFERMCEEGIQKNDITFMSLLSACSHAGLVDEGLHYFESMSSVYSISATLEHYTCMVGLLGRAGYMHEAKNLINTMSCESDSSVWRALLGACRVHGDLEMGEYIAKKCFELNP